MQTTDAFIQDLNDSQSWKQLRTRLMIKEGKLPCNSTPHHKTKKNQIHPSPPRTREYSVWPNLRREMQYYLARDEREDGGDLNGADRGL